MARSSKSKENTIRQANVIGVSARKAPPSGPSLARTGSIRPFAPYYSTPPSPDPSSSSVSSLSSPEASPLTPYSCASLHSPTRALSSESPQQLSQTSSPNPAISHFDNNHTVQSCGHVFPVNYSPNPPIRALFESTPSTTEFHQHGTAHSPAPGSTYQHALASQQPSLRTLPQLPALIARHGLPTQLPPLPRTTSVLPTPAQPPAPPAHSSPALTNLSSLTSSFLAMLQDPNFDTSIDPESIRTMEYNLPKSDSLSGSNALDSLFASAYDPAMSFEQLFGGQAPSPFVAPVSSFDDDNCSPVLGVTSQFGLETPASTAFSVSPHLTDFDETSPSLAFDDTAVDAMFSEMPLFGCDAPSSDPFLGIVASGALGLNVDSLDMSSLIPMSPAPPTSFLPSPMVTDTPSTPDTSLPSVTPKTRSSSIAASSAPTGHRKNITPASLVPVDAPTQQRKYTKASATSRKEIPAAFQNRTAVVGKKRGVSEALGEDASLEDAIEAKRRQNTVAARRSRARKLEHVRELEMSIASLTEERNQALERAEKAEQQLRALGIAP